MYTFVCIPLLLLVVVVVVVVQEGLQRLADAHPEVIAHMDEGVRTRIASMPTAKVRQEHTHGRCCRPPGVCQGYHSHGGVVSCFAKT